MTSCVRIFPFNNSTPNASTVSGIFAVHVYNVYNKCMHMDENQIITECTHLSTIEWVEYMHARKLAGMDVGMYAHVAYWFVINMYALFICIILPM